MTKQLHALVNGRVQGVWFRGWTREQAASLNLSGWVRNLPDGRVEALAQGPEDRLQSLLSLLHQGPGQARVDSVEHTLSDPAQELDGGFEVRW